MNREHRKDVLTLAAIAIAGSLLIVSLVAKGPHVVHDPLTAVPSNAFIVVNIDVRSLASSPLGAALAGEKGAHAGAFFGVDSIEGTCGFDPLPHVEGIAISVPEGDTHGELGIAVTGDIPKGSLVQCAKALIEKRGGTWSMRESSSYSVVSENNEHGAEIAFREGGPVLVGRGEWLERMIDTVEGRSKSMAVPNDDLHHALRADVATSDPEAKALVASAVLPRDLRDRIGAELVEAPDGGEAPGNAAMQGVLGVSGVSLAVRAGKAHEETRVVGELRCDGDPTAADIACKKVETLILHERLKLSGDVRVRLSGLGPLVDGLQTQVAGGALTLKTSAPSDTLARVLTRMLDAPHAKGGPKGSEPGRGAAPAPGAPPTPGTPAPPAPSPQAKGSGR